MQLANVREYDPLSDNRDAWIIEVGEIEWFCDISFLLEYTQGFPLKTFHWKLPQGSFQDQKDTEGINFKKDEKTH